jgi:phage terminase large subunit GpA-like protein
MPCRECGESARENGSHGSVFGLQYDEDGTARYICLNCGIEIMKEEIEL